MFMEQSPDRLRSISFRVSGIILMLFQPPGISIVYLPGSTYHYASVAQRIELRSSTPTVAGSSPAWRTIFDRHTQTRLGIADSWRSFLHPLTIRDLAQLAEHSLHMRAVAGSNPAVSTTILCFSLRLTPFAYNCRHSKTHKNKKESP